jgi:hypothetical protein
VSTISTAAAIAGALLEQLPRPRLELRRWWLEHLELVLATAGVALLGAALGWLAVWLGSGGAG